MSSINPTSYPAFFVVVLVLCYAVGAIRRRNRLTYPPGPPGLPLLGNLFQLSSTPWKEFQRWREEYGPLVYLTVAGRGMLILNSHTAAVSLLDHRGQIYSNRPRLIVASEMLAGGMFIGGMNFSDRFRRMRRAGHEGLSKHKVAEYHPIQSREAITLADDMLRDPAGWEAHFSRAAASTILSVVYDLPQVVSNSDPLVRKISEFGIILKAAHPAAHLVEFFPWMKHIPSSIARWKRKVEGNYKEYSKLFGGLFREVENQINNGDERPSLAGTLIRDRLHHGLDDMEASWFSGTMYLAGFESTTTTLIWFMLAMISSPEKQKKCQEELDAVVGRSRMPTLKDRENLPYLQATVRELLRWRPVVPLVLHSTKEDDLYDGYFIPKGTICVANLWCINRDRDVYGIDADDFNPDRFLDEKRQLSPVWADTKDGHLSFGFGPRICLGRHMANNSLFITTACLLWATQISPVRDDNGTPIIPDTLETVPGQMVVRPRPFKCSISPRFPEAAAIVSQSKELI